MGIVIYPPTLDWDYMKQRPQQLMTHFARNGYTVLYFNQYNKAGPVVTKVSANLYVIHHATFFFNHLYPQLQSKDLKLFWTSWSSKIPLASRFQAEFTIYDCVDNFPEWEEDERTWVPTVEAIVCTAPSLEKKMTALAPDKPVTIIPNGCDWEHFSNCLSLHTQQLETLPPKQNYALGYIGAWAPWVDAQLVHMMAKTYSNLQIVIAGPMLMDKTIDLPNVHFLGLQPYERLPAILSYLDICLIPFLSNQITNSTDPIKLYEYLSAGKKVISTDIAEVRRWTPYVHIGKNKEDFVQLIAHTLNTTKPSPLELSNFSKQFSWEQRYRLLSQWILHHFPHFKPLAKPITVNLAYHNTEIPLEFCTVNSHYFSRNLADNPGFLGWFQSTEYQCYLKIPFGHQVPNYPIIHLDFDLYFTDSIPGEIHVGLVSEEWMRTEITFENKPASIHLATLKTEELFNQTCSVEITPFLKKDHPFPSFQLSTNCQLIRVTNPRLTGFSVH